MKILKKFISAISAVSIMLTAVPYCTVADEYNGFSIESIQNSEIKPKITVTSECISFNEARENPIREINICVEGANYKYCSTGMHIHFDKRLDIDITPIGTPAVEVGDALKYCTVDTPTIDLTAEEYGMKGVFVQSAANNNFGEDGVIWTISLILPDDVQPGDVYPVDIIYKSNPAAKDLFTNVDNDTTGKLMQAYAFTYGIYNRKRNYNFSADADDLAECSALADIDKSYDGYIAIADKQETTAPIESTTTTTRRTTTTTTTTRTTATTRTTTATTTASTESSLIIIPSEVNMGIGDTNKLAVAGVQNISDVMWTSGDTHVATVDKNGNVTARNAGNAMIYAVYKGNIASCTIKVSNENINYGDANEDGQINMADVTAIVQHIGNRDEYGLDDTGLRSTDVNSDGQVTGEDALIIQEFIAGMYESLPI